MIMGGMKIISGSQGRNDNSTILECALETRTNSGVYVGDSEILIRKGSKNFSAAKMKYKENPCYYAKEMISTEELGQAQIFINALGAMFNSDLCWIDLDSGEQSVRFLLQPGMNSSEIDTQLSILIQACKATFLEKGSSAETSN